MNLLYRNVCIIINLLYRDVCIIINLLYGDECIFIKLIIGYIMPNIFSIIKNKYLIVNVRVQFD